MKKKLDPELQRTIREPIDERVRKIEVRRSDPLKLEKAFRQLAAVQARTELALQQLSQQVDHLSDHRFKLEDIAHVVVPGYLLRHYGIRMGEFERKFLTEDGEEIEIDLYAEGEREGETVVILGEVKSRIFQREVEQFSRTISKFRTTLAKKPFPLMFGYWIHPTASAEAQKHGIELITSYQR